MIDGPALESLLTNIYARLGEQWRDGRVADYIPQLSGVPPDRFGIALALFYGRVMTIGEADEPFPTQISLA